MKKAVVELTAGIAAIITELVAKGFSSLVAEEDGVTHVVGLHRQESATDRNTPCMALLLGSDEVMDALASIQWDNATILAIVPHDGTSIHGAIAANPMALARWRVYFPDIEGQMQTWMDWA